MSETKLKKTNTVNEKKEEKEITKEFMKSLFGGLDFDLCLALIKVSLVDIAKQYMWESEIPDKEKARRALVAFGSCVEYENNVPSYIKRLHNEFPELIDENGCGLFYLLLLSMDTFYEAEGIFSEKAMEHFRKTQSRTVLAWKIFYSVFLQQIKINDASIKMFTIENILSIAYEEGPCESTTE